MAQRESEIPEHAVHTVAEQAVKADELVDEAKAAGGGIIQSLSVLVGLLREAER